MLFCELIMYETIDDKILSRAIVKSGEKMEPLGGGYAVIQPSDGYRFGTDAVTLARFAGGNISCGARVLDLCSGCGVVGLILCAEKGAKVVGAEIDKDLCDMSNRSAEANMFDAKFFNIDLKTNELSDICNWRLYDAVTCNPPFFKASSKPRNIAPTANSELTIDFERIAEVTESLLEIGGKFFFVHTLSRLDEIICTCEKHSLRFKKLVINKNRKTFTAMCSLGGKAGLQVEVE